MCNTLAEWRVADRPEEKKNTYQHLSTLIQIQQSSEDSDDPSEYACPFHSATKLAEFVLSDRVIAIGINAVEESLQSRGSFLASEFSIAVLIVGSNTFQQLLR